MPSSAFKKFENKMLTDVDRLIQSHKTLSNGAAGKHGLGHITRSGVFLLCAAWELFAEELIVEMTYCLAERARSPSNLPKAVQKELSKHVKDHKHELRPLELAGDGWRSVYKTHAQDLVSGLNTPKADPLSVLFRRATGWTKATDCWALGTAYIDDFVTIRGNIAHKGSDADYIRLNKLQDNYRVGIAETALQLDNAACDFLKESSEGGRPWRRRI
jgi:hypothetical protein